MEASATAASLKAPGARRLSRRPRPKRPLGASKASLGGGAALRRAERRAATRSCTAATVPANGGCLECELRSCVGSGWLHMTACMPKAWLKDHGRRAACSYSVISGPAETCA